MNYTKGKWKVDKQGRDYPNMVIEPTSGRVIADCYDSEANAHLIASAPDMYEALREICRRYDEDGILDISPARKALAKAEGK